MKVKYVNMRGPWGVETIDEIREDEHADFKAYKAEIRNVIRSYREAGANVYISQRSTNSWKQQ